jgi:hypothetical protein
MAYRAAAGNNMDIRIKNDLKGSIGKVIRQK